MTVQIKDLSPVSKMEGEDILHLQTEGGVDKRITLNNLISNSVETTEWLINNIHNFQVGAVYTTTGFKAPADGGAAQWIKTPLTGQTPSQTPAQLNGALLNDANGDQWEMVCKDIFPPSFGAIGGNSNIDDSPALNAAFNSLRIRVNSGDKKVVFNGGSRIYYAFNSINGTKISGNSWSYTFRDLYIYGKCAGKIVLDFIGSRGGYAESITVEGDPTDKPSQGIVFARSAESGFGFCDNWNINSLVAIGKFTVAATHFYAQESTKYGKINAWNSDLDGRAAIFDGTGAFPINSDFTTPVTGSRSYINNTYLSLDVRDFPAKRVTFLSNITNAANAVVTVNNPTLFSVGNKVTMVAVKGMSEINNIIGEITNIAGNDITLDIDSSLFGSYTTGGSIYLTRNNPPMFFSRGAQHRFISAYVVSYGQPHIEISLADVNETYECDLDFLFEGAGAPSNFHFTGMSGKQRLKNINLSTYKVNALESIVSKEGGFDLTFDGGGVSVSSWANSSNATPLLVAPQGQFEFFNCTVKSLNNVPFSPSLVKGFSGTYSNLNSDKSLSYGEDILSGIDSTYTPVVSSSIGTINSVTINNAEFVTIGNIVTVLCDITVTDAGTGTGALFVSLPIQGKNNQILKGKSLLTGDSLTCAIQAGGIDVSCRKYDNATIIATGTRFSFSGSYIKT